MIYSNQLHGKSLLTLFLILCYFQCNSRVTSELFMQLSAALAYLTTPYEKHWLKYFPILVICLHDLHDVSDQRILQSDWRELFQL